jgi:hypothetical protein
LKAAAAQVERPEGGRRCPFSHSKAICTRHFGGVGSCEFIERENRNPECNTEKDRAIKRNDLTATHPGKNRESLMTSKRSVPTTMPGNCCVEKKCAIFCGHIV